MEPSRVERVGYEGLQHLLPAAFWRKHALWEMIGHDAHGHVIQHGIFENLITDVGGTALLQNTYNTTGGAVAPFKFAAMAQATASTVLTSALSTGAAITSIPVAALPAGSSIANGLTITLTSGSNTQIVTAAASASAGATSITVASFTPNFAYPIGSTVIPNPQFTDNPASLVGAVYTTLGSFVYNAGQATGTAPYSGNGARLVTATATFTGTVSTTSYTELFICNTNPVTAIGQTSNHLTIPSTPLANGATQTYNFSERA